MRTIIPAILASDKESFERSLKKIEGLSDWLQIDIMDGAFVESTSVGLNELLDLKLPANLEIHLMVNQPTDYFDSCSLLRAKRVIVHCECPQSADEILEKAGTYDFDLGVAINPDTPIDAAKTYFQKVLYALIMSVIPGKQGNPFRADVLPKINELKKISPSLTVGIDGGVSMGTILDIAKTSVDYCIVGGALINAEDPKNTFNLLQNT